MSTYEPGGDVEAPEYDATNVQIDGDFTIPEAEYILVVKKVRVGRSKVKIDQTTGKESGGYYQVQVDSVVDEGDRKGFPVNYYYVTFLPPTERAAGMAIKFLKSIGEPWQGKFKPDPSRWAGRRFRAFLEHQEYKGKKNMKIAWTEPIESEVTEQPGEEDVPW